MNQITFVVEVLEPKQHLHGDEFDECTWDTFLLMSFYKRQEVLPKWLKDDADMGSFESLMRE
jgi:hypothetical protein